MGIRQNNCEVRSHNAEIVFSQTSATPDFPNPVTYFEDHTENHYKALINVRAVSLEGEQPVNAEFTFQVVVKPRNLPEFSVDIPFFPITVGGIIGQVVVQIEDAESVSLRWEVRVNGVLVEDIITGTISIQKDFCICCP